MSELIIAVGSTRKPELAAVREAVDGMSDLLAAETSIEIVGVEVESGVNHTPLSCEESMRGARQRAEWLQQVAKREAKPWNYFVGLEGGIAVIGDGERRVFLESWAYVSDGTRGHFGRSAAVELPEALAEEVFVRGKDLSITIDQFAGGEAGIRDAQGAWGVLSGNKITRQEAFRVALIAAFAPFFNQPMYRRTVVAG